MNFKDLSKNYMKKLSLYVPVVARVHGAHHPEFHEVKALFEKMSQKIKDAGRGRPELAEEFAALRAVTGGYAVPGDVCESYEAVYTLLDELDRAYRA